MAGKWKPDPEAAREKVNKAIETLDQGVKGLVNSDSWRDYLDFNAKFHRYSFSNIMLIKLQMPSATRVAGFHAWEKLKRHVKKGEHGLTILAPCRGNTLRKEIRFNPELGADEEVDVAYPRIYFRAVSVFDVSQTEGEPLPEVCPTLKGDDFGLLFEAVEGFSTGRGVTVELGSTLPAHGYYRPLSKQIVLDEEEASMNQRVKTLLHEVAHSLLHGPDDDMSREDRELEAESTAYVVLKTLGFDTGSYSFGYVAHWAQDTDFSKQLKASGERIQKAANEIISALTGTSEEEDVA